MEKVPEILHLVINLEHSVVRREKVMEQAGHLGLDVQFVKAVSGRDLDVDSLEDFDRNRRKKLFTHDLRPNEHACIQSHLRAMRQFLNSDYQYCIISEDDVLFLDGFEEKIRFILKHTEGWEMLKLFSGECLRYDVVPGQEGNPVRLQFPKKFPWGAISNIYTRKAAETLLDGFKGYWMGFDVQAAQICFDRGLPCCGVTPDIVDTFFRSNEESDIDADGPRLRYGEAAERSTAQYLRYRFYVWGMAMGKIRMRKLLSRVLRLK